ncbi:MAG: hypothetical protein JWN95_1882 [Frankiales bacterium]|nr:hypothetical protein [Frankiales bacterium]
MSTKLTKRLVGAGALAATASSLMFLGAGAANAAIAPGSGAGGGTLTAASLATGSDLSAPTVVTSGGCGTDGADSFLMRLYGAGFSSDGFVITTPTDAGFSTSAPITASFGLTFKDAATLAGTTIQTGEYDLRLQCVDTLGDVFTDFTTEVDFTSPTAYSFKTAGPTQVTTATSLTVTPGTSASVGDPVTLTAAITPAATGSVQFKDGAANLGSPVTVAAGSASLVTSALTAATHSLSAVFTPTDAAAFTSSTSAVISYPLNGTTTPGATATTTTLAADNTSVATGDPITFTAAVAPADAVGSVDFKDGSATIGSQPVAAGTASLTLSSLSVGPHSITATFVPTDATAFGTSDSAAVTVTVTGVVTPPTTGNTDVQNIQGTVDAGTVTVSTPYTPTSPLDLGTLALNSDATLLSASKPFENITVTDTRVGATNLGWSMTAKSSNLISGTDAINGENVGLTGLTKNLVAGNAQDGSTVTVTNVPAANGVSAADAGTAGLKSGPTVAAATAGRGTIGLSGQLTLNAPTSTNPGLYKGTVTFTIS